MSGQRLFRQSALDRLSSPDQLDRLVTLTDSRGWLAVMASGLMLGVFVFWAFWGSLPVYVSGQGILLPSTGRVLDAVSLASGTLTQLVVAPGQNVSKGQTVAVVDQQELALGRQNALQTIHDMEAALARFDRDYRQEIQARSADVEGRRKALTTSITEGDERVRFLTETLTQQEQLAGQGYFSARALNDAQIEISRAKLAVSDYRNELARLDSDLIQLRNQYERERSRQEVALNEARRQAQEQALVLKRNTRVEAPATGRVVEVKAAPGTLLAAHQPILSIESEQTTGNSLEALVYIPTKDGKRLAVGQDVRLALANVKKEEYGNLVGKVRSISTFPVSVSGMNASVSNSGLLGQFSQGGAPYEVRVDLFAAPALPSGYRWTSAEGPPFPITSGTTLTVEVTVLEQRPISLLIPFLRRTTGIYLH